MKNAISANFFEDCVETTITKMMQTKSANKRINADFFKKIIIADCHLIFHKLRCDQYIWDVHKDKGSGNAAVGTLDISQNHSLFLALNDFLLFPKIKTKW